MRCSACGARNSDDAVWCTQCYADVSGRDPTTSALPSAPEGVASRARSVRDVRDVDGEVQWRCGACDGWSPLTAPSCVVCGTDREGFGGPAVPSVRADINETVAVVASLVLPGLGHILGGRLGTGLARALLALLWSIGGIAVLAGSSGITALPGWVLVAGAVVLWVVSAIDARSLVAGTRRELLGTRGLAALVLAVTVLLVVSAGIVMVSGR